MGSNVWSTAQDSNDIFVWDKKVKITIPYPGKNINFIPMKRFNFVEHLRAHSSPVLCLAHVTKQSLASKVVNLTRKVSNEIILSGGEEGVMCVWESRTVRYPSVPIHNTHNLTLTHSLARSLTNAHL